jgi:hypothetical protein
MGGARLSPIIGEDPALPHIETMIGRPAMGGSFTKEIMRWLHITGGMILFAYVYTPLVENPFFVDATKYVIFPGLALTGLVMWQWPIFRGLFRHKD